MDSVCDCCGEQSEDVSCRVNGQPLCDVCEDVRQDLSNEDDGLNNE